MKMRHRIFAAALVAAATPLAAGADVCPTGADLATGITLSSTINGTETRKTFTSHLGGLQTSMVYQVAQEPAQGPFPSWRAHALTQPSDPEGKTGVVIYENAVDLLDELNTRGSWSSFADSIHISGNTVRIAQYFNFLDSDEFSIGSCSYTVWRIGAFNEWYVAADAELQNPTRIPRTVYLYAPELRIILAEQRMLGSSNRYSWINLNDEITAE